MQCEVSFEISMVAIDCGQGHVHQAANTFRQLCVDKLSGMVCLLH